MQQRKFHIDRKACMGTGLCFGAYPDSFEPVDPNQARVRNKTAAFEDIESAARNCPTGAIRETDLSRRR